MCPLILINVYHRTVRWLDCWIFQYDRILNIEISSPLYIPIFQFLYIRTMPIRLAQVIYISPDSDAPARPRISPGSPISFVLS